MLSEGLPRNLARKMDTLTSHQQNVARVINVMSEQLDMPLSLQEMAEIAHSSPFHFSRVFRNTTGIPPIQFLYALRIQKAKNLLLTTNRSVTDICYEVGYNSLGTFTRRFTELVGLSPTRLRSIHNSAAFASSLEVLCRFVSDWVRDAAPQRGLSGRISAPPAFAGLIFIGVFPTRIPEGPPVGCAFLTTSGAYYVGALPYGNYSVFAAAYSCSLNPDYVGTSPDLIRVEGYRSSGCADVRLRPVDSIDPPVLFAAPYLFAERLGIGVR